MATGTSQQATTKYPDHMSLADDDLEDIKELLKKSVVRLSIAASGNDSRLDHTLRDIRQSVKHGLNARELEIGLDKLSADIHALDSQPNNGSNEFNDSFFRELKNFNFSVGALGYKKRLSELVGQKLRDQKLALQLLHVINDIASNEDQFRTLSEQQLAEVRKVASTIRGHLGCDKGACASLDLPALISDMERQFVTLLRLLADTRSNSRTDIPVVDEAHEILEIPDVPDLPELDEIASHGIDQGVQRDMAEILVYLVESLSLPDELYQQGRELAEVLRGIDDESLDFKDYASAISRLANEAISLVQEQKYELLQFIQKTSEQLADIETFVRHSRDEQEESVSQSAKLQDSVDQSVEDIQREVSSSEDIEHLKQGIQVHLQGIREKVEEHRKAEENKQTASCEHYANILEELTVSQEQNSELKKQLEQSQKQMLRDILTGIPNRKSFEERLDIEYKRWMRDRNGLSVAIWDIDHFKKVNDTYGHDAGDRVLQIFAQVIGDRIRKTDHFARIGGEEFVLIMPDTELRMALQLNDELRVLLKECRFHYDGQDVPITASVGIASFEEGDTVDTAMKRADVALYNSKNAGRDMCTTGMIKLY